MYLARYGFSLLLAIFLFSGTSLADDNRYTYISAADLEARLNAKLPTQIVDIQVEEEFVQHHIKGATPTYAYPVKSDADRAKLDTTVEQIKGNNDLVVIVCPRGAGGAKRTYDYLLQQGISAERLQILEKGQEGWSCIPLTESR
jgi:thiosulfate/3-mercaptopyruvate sulfurtransferase